MLTLQMVWSERVIPPGTNYLIHRVGTQCLEEDFGRYLVESIDNAKVFDKNVCISPIFGGIPPERLSGGLKNLLTLAYAKTDIAIDIAGFGRNCFPYIVEISKMRDIVIYMGIAVGLFKDTGLEKAYVLEEDKWIYSNSEMYDMFSKYESINTTPYGQTE